MHDTAHAIGRLFFETYFPGRAIAILDIGSQSINGSLRDCAPAGSLYTGVDLVAGPGVDIVLESPPYLPFGDRSFDAVVSSSAFEHDPAFWLTFIEMLRVTKAGGLVYVNSPSNGEYHRYPGDNWRFYPDAAVALAEWARQQGHDAELVESFIARRRADQWNDCVMVFRLGAGDLPVARRIVDSLPDARNIRRGAAGAVERQERQTEDMLLLAEAQARLAARERELAEIAAELRQVQAKLSALVPDWVGFDC